MTAGRRAESRSVGLPGNTNAGRRPSGVVRSAARIGMTRARQPTERHSRRRLNAGWEQLGP